MQLDSWPPAPISIHLTDHEVHIWRIDLDQPEAIWQELVLTLNHEERARADRFHFERERIHSIVARGALRAILSRYLNIDPAQVPFVYNPYGKPMVPTSHISFNLSHSHGLALCAVTWDRQIGIDIEYQRPLQDVEHIAGHYFFAGEFAALRSLLPEQYLARFFIGWTRKEAFIKAIGTGFSMPLDEFEVTLDQPARLLHIHGDRGAAARWIVLDLTAAPNYAAALVIEAEGIDYVCWQWQGK